MRWRENVKVSVRGDMIFVVEDVEGVIIRGISGVRLVLCLLNGRGICVLVVIRHLELGREIKEERMRHLGAIRELVDKRMKQGKSGNIMDFIEGESKTYCWKCKEYILDSEYISHKMGEKG